MGVLLSENRSITPRDDAVPFSIFAQKSPTNSFDVAYGIGSPEKPIETIGRWNLAETGSAKMEENNVVFIDAQKPRKGVVRAGPADYFPWPTGTEKHCFACRTSFRCLHEVIQIEVAVLRVVWI